MEDPRNERWLSPASSWDLLVLVDKGRVILTVAPATWIRAVMGALPFKEAPVSHELEVKNRAVGLPHRDPVDRFLAATATVYQLTLVTGDGRLLRSRIFEVLANG